MPALWNTGQPPILSQLDGHFKQLVGLSAGHAITINEEERRAICSND
jgi:hypothetical protein